jgi:hypothetical protein
MLRLPAAAAAVVVVHRLMLYCALTGQLMDKSLAAVKKHMQGKKFLRAKGEQCTNTHWSKWQHHITIGHTFWSVRNHPLLYHLQHI